MHKPLLLTAASLVVLLAPQPGMAQSAPSSDAEDPCSTGQEASPAGEKVKCQALTADVRQHPAERLYMLRVRLQRQKGHNWLLVITSSSSWNFLDTDTAHVEIGDTSREVAFRIVDAKRDEGGVIEQNAIKLTEAQLRTLTEASSMQIRVNGAILQLPAETLARHAQALLR
jgi:hypothetical protein